jgi:hypothetical protein
MYKQRVCASFEAHTSLLKKSPRTEVEFMDAVVHHPHFQETSGLMTQAPSTITINAPADAIWQVISDFGAACQYLAPGSSIARLRARAWARAAH